VFLKADLGAEKLFAAERNERKIVVEIKVFGGLSFFCIWQQVNIAISIITNTRTKKTPRR
jgi:hypothetical protein